MYLLHGTTTAHEATIRREGLHSPYLTADAEVAAYYAEVAADENGARALILQLEIPDQLLSQLRADHPSFEEPLTFYRNAWASNDREWHRRLGEKDGIPYPENGDDWRTSLEVVRSVRFAGHLEPAHVLPAFDPALPLGDTPQTARRRPAP